MSYIEILVYAIIGEVLNVDLKMWDASLVLFMVVNLVLSGLKLNILKMNDEELYQTAL